MGTVVAVRHNPVRHSLLRPAVPGAGKVKKVALSACMRKLLPILNAMVKHHKPWHVQEVPSALNRPGPLDNQDSCYAPASLRLLPRA